MIKVNYYILCNKYIRVGVFPRTLYETPPPLQFYDRHYHLPDGLYKDGYESAIRQSVIHSQTHGQPVLGFESGVWFGKFSEI